MPSELFLWAATIADIHSVGSETGVRMLTILYNSALTLSCMATGILCVDLMTGFSSGSNFID